jgi:hypothetical protein
MADDRERNQGMKEGGYSTGGGQQGGQGATQTPGRNPQGDKSTGGRDLNQDAGNVGDQKDGQNRGMKGDQHQGGSYKEGGQNEQTRR